MRLLLFGCTGFIGRELVPILLDEGHEITLISRKYATKIKKTIPLENIKFLRLDPTDPKSYLTEEFVSSLSNAEGVINLAGEPIAEKRWTAKQIIKIEDSRLKTTQNLIDALQKLNKPPRVLINGSAIGFYGTSEITNFTEDSSPGNDFLASLCKRWEKIAQEKPRSTKLVIIRIGIVLASDGGALGKMLPIFKAGFGGPIGSGNQLMSWIHRTDLCEIIREALNKKSWSGTINGVAPSPVSMSQFALELGKTLRRPCLLPLPGPILQLLLGDGAQVVLEGQKVSSNRLLKLGFKFKYPNLNQALDSATIQTKH